MGMEEPSSNQLQIQLPRFLPGNLCLKCSYISVVACNSWGNKSANLGTKITIRCGARLGRTDC